MSKNIKVVDHTVILPVLDDTTMKTHAVGLLPHSLILKNAVVKHSTSRRNYTAFFRICEMR